MKTHPLKHRDGRKGVKRYVMVTHSLIHNKNSPAKVET